jgi:predicted nuclease of predicted toxin-antitoxin system
MKRMPYSIEFLLDENMPFALIEFLETKGFRIKHLKKIGKVGIKNGEVYKIAEKEHLWIITRDADFENYRKFVTYNVGGIIVFKLSDTRTPHLLNKMKQFLEKYQDKLGVKRLIVIEASEIKIYESS